MSIFEKFEKPFKKSIANQIETFAQNIYKKYRADIVSDSIKEKLKASLVSKVYKLQEKEISSLESIYHLLHDFYKDCNKNAIEDIQTLVFQLIPHQESHYSLLQVSNILKAFARTQYLSLEKVKEILGIIQNKLSLKMVNDMEELVIKLSSFKFSHSNNARCYNLLDKVLILPANKLDILCKLFCEKPENISTLTPNTKRLTKRLVGHIEDLCALHDSILIGFHAILNRFLKENVFSDESNREQLNTIMFRLTKCIIHIVQAPDSESRNAISICDLQAFFERLSEKRLISVENLNAIFTLGCLNPRQFKSDKNEQVDQAIIQNIQNLIGRTQGMYYQGALNAENFNFLIGKLAQSNQERTYKGFIKKHSSYNRSQQELFSDNQPTGSVSTLAFDEPPPPYTPRASK